MKTAVLITGQLRDYKINCLNHVKHLIEPNNADVFVYACTQNTIHSCGQSLDQKYYRTACYSKDEIISNVTEIYGSHLKLVEVDNNEKLTEDDFGTLGYFRTRMQNQIDNIGKGFAMAKSHDDYDVIIRCRPDNSMYLQPVEVKDFPFNDTTIYSTVFMPSRHRDLCFFAMANPHVFEKYCSYEYLKGEDPNRKDSNFLCTEHAWEGYLMQNGINVQYIPDVCRPFTQFDKSTKVADFPYRNEKEKLVDHHGNWVDQIV
tara:strand:- start:123 stop:899 length:777 start_codon:yes stop_codon:yes gene_type:complete